MNIKGITDNLGTDPLGRAASSQRQKSQTSPTAAVQSNDKVDMSKLSTLMARSAQDLDAHLAARQEKVEQFRNDLNASPQLSDEVIDTIWRRMLGR